MLCKVILTTIIARLVHHLVLDGCLLSLLSPVHCSLSDGDCDTGTLSRETTLPTSPTWSQQIIFLTMVIDSK